MQYKHIGSLGGFDASSLNAFSWSNSYQGVHLLPEDPSWHPLADPQPVFTFDFNTPDPMADFQPQELTLKFTVTQPGVVNGVAFWFDLHMLPDSMVTPPPHPAPACTTAAPVAPAAAGSQTRPGITLPRELRTAGGPVGVPAGGGVLGQAQQVTLTSSPYAAGRATTWPQVREAGVWACMPDAYAALPPWHHCTASCRAAWRPQCNPRYTPQYNSWCVILPPPPPLLLLLLQALQVFPGGGQVAIAGDTLHLRASHDTYAISFDLVKPLTQGHGNAGAVDQQMQVAQPREGAVAGSQPSAWAVWQATQRQAEALHQLLHQNAAQQPLQRRRLWQAALRLALLQPALAVRGPRIDGAQEELAGDGGVQAAPASAAALQAAAVAYLAQFMKT